MTNKRKEPRWVVAFLRALERTGEVRSAAKDAGIDHSTAYARRRAHGEFAQAWRGTLVAHEKWVKGKEAEELAAVARPGFDSPSPSQASGLGPALSREGRGAESEELVGGGSQLKRAGHGRWSQAKEKLFFEELAATANVRRAAGAAGVSTNAVYARRMKKPVFRAQWDAVLEAGRAAIEMKLVEAANRSFDPDEIDVGVSDASLANRAADGRAGPVVSVAEAIRIVKLHGSKAQSETLQQQASQMSEDEVEALRERLLKKMERLADRTRRDRLDEGWALDEEHGQLVPPGWVRAEERHRPPES